jgi:hypothetical protein
MNELQISTTMRTAPSRAAPLVAVLAFGFGCGGGDDGGGDDGPEANIVLRDANNYSSEAALSLPNVDTASGSDIEICFGAVMTDFQCHDVMPQEQLDTIGMLRLRLSKQDAAERLATSELEQRELDGYLDYETSHDATCIQLSDMTFFGTPIDVEEEYVESDDHTYVLLFSEGTTPGVGAQSMMFITPSASSDNTSVEAEAGCGLLDFSADIGRAEPVEVPIDGPWVVGWREITRNSQGFDIAFENIDELVLGFFEDMTVEELEEQVFDLELLATNLWEIELKSGRTADLAEAEERDSGRKFSSFERDAEGVWLLGLMCSTCQHPTPLVLSVLEPVAGGGE